MDKKQKQMLIIVIAIVALVFALKGGVFSGALIPGEDYCYQEESWLVTAGDGGSACGDVTLDYSDYPTWSSGGIFTITWYKPHVLPADYVKDAVYRLKYGDYQGESAEDIDIPSACFNAYTDRIQIQVITNVNNGVWAQCWNGVDWQIFTTVKQGQAGMCPFSSYAFHTYPPFAIEVGTQSFDGNWDTYLTGTGGNSFVTGLNTGSCTNYNYLFYEEAMNWHIIPYPTVPGQPAGTTINVVNQNITLGWSAASGVVDNYLLYRQVSGGGFSLYQTLPPTTFSFLDGDLLPATTYSYRISAVNFVGEGLYNQPGDVTTWPECTLGSWSSSDGACQPSNTLTRTWTKLAFCNGGVMHPATEIISCTYSAPPTCSDGIQNQGETGIDCGGPCSACQVTPPSGGGGGGGGGGSSAQPIQPTNQTGVPAEKEGMTNNQKLMLGGLAAIALWLIFKRRK